MEQYMRKGFPKSIDSVSSSLLNWNMNGGNEVAFVIPGFSSIVQSLISWALVLGFTKYCVRCVSQEWVFWGNANRMTTPAVFTGNDFVSASTASLRPIAAFLAISSLLLQTCVSIAALSAIALPAFWAVPIDVTSVPTSRDAPRGETSHLYFELKQL